jgi:hypothetical protein
VKADPAEAKPDRALREGGPPTNSELQPGKAAPASFPQSLIGMQNNSNIVYVIESDAQMMWSAALTGTLSFAAGRLVMY